MKPLLARIADVAALLAVSEREVWSLIGRGDLTPIRPDNGTRIVRIRIAEVEALVDRWAGLSSGSAGVPSDEPVTEARVETRRAGSRGKREDRLMSTGRREQNDDTASERQAASTTV